MPGRQYVKPVVNQNVEEQEYEAVKGTIWGMEFSE